MSRNTFKQILGIQIWKFTDSQVYETLLKIRSTKNALKWLPKYCLREKTGTIDRAEQYLQFRSEGDKEWWLFDKVFSDSILEEEIDAIDIDEILQGINLIPIFEKLEWHKYEEFHRIVPDSSKLILQIEYSCYSGPDGEDCDSNTKLIGYMDKELNIIPI